MANRSRPIKFTIYLSSSENEKLTEKANKAGLSKGAFLRKQIDDCVIKEAPNADIPILIRDIRRVGTNVNQLLKQVNTTHLLDAPQMRKVLAEAWLAEKAIVDAFAPEG